MSNIEYVPKEWNHHRVWSVYCLMVDIGSDQMLMKIGYSKDPILRIGRAITFVPGPPVLMWTPRLPKGSAQRIEKRLHRKLKKYSTWREWFKFNLDDKPAFNQAVRAAWSIDIHGELKWNKSEGKELVSACHDAEKNPSLRRAQRYVHE